MVKFTPKICCAVLALHFVQVDISVEKEIAIQTTVLLISIRSSILCWMFSSALHWKDGQTSKWWCSLLSHHSFMFFSSPWSLWVHFSYWICCWPLSIQNSRKHIMSISNKKQHWNWKKQNKAILKMMKWTMLFQIRMKWLLVNLLLPEYMQKRWGLSSGNEKNKEQLNF